MLHPRIVWLTIDNLFASHHTTTTLPPLYHPHSLFYATDLVSARKQRHASDTLVTCPRPSLTAATSFLAATINSRCCGDILFKPVIESFVVDFLFHPEFISCSFPLAVIFAITNDDIEYRVSTFRGDVFNDGHSFSFSIVIMVIAVQVYCPISSPLDPTSVEGIGHVVLQDSEQRRLERRTPTSFSIFRRSLGPIGVGVISTGRWWLA
jgi:hypothetical protein